MCHNEYTPCELSRESHYDWKLDDISFIPKIAPPTIDKVTWKGGSEEKTTYSYIVTSVMKEKDFAAKYEALGDKVITRIRMEA